MPNFFTPWNRQNACGKKKLALHKDQFYSNTRVPKQLNTIQHGSDTNQHESDTSQHESDTNQHEPNTNQHESTRAQNK